VRQSLSHLQTPQLGPVSVSACAAEALNRVHIPPTVHVQLVDLAGLPAVLAGYQGLTLVFTNLLENASDAMGGNGAIEIRGSASDTAVAVSVRDSGPGVAPDLHERIFELSFSGRRSGKLGFGLWWVKTWMTRLGGSVTIESDGAQGACFRLHLPRAEEGT
jgi:signal transduction histidine kinase